MWQTVLEILIPVTAELLQILICRYKCINLNYLYIILLLKKIVFEHNFLNFSL